MPAYVLIRSDVLIMPAEATDGQRVQVAKLFESRGHVWAELENGLALMPCAFEIIELDAKSEAL